MLVKSYKLKIYICIFISISLSLVSASIGAIRPILITALGSGEQWYEIISFESSIFKYKDSNNLYILVIAELADFILLIINGVVLTNASSKLGRIIRIGICRSTLYYMRTGDAEEQSKLIIKLKTHVDNIEAFIRLTFIPTITALFQLIFSLGLAFKIGSMLALILFVQIFLYLVCTLAYGQIYISYVEQKFNYENNLLSHASLDVRKGTSIWFGNFGFIWLRNRIIEIKKLCSARCKIGYAESVYFSLLTFGVGTSIICGYIILIQMQELPSKNFLAFVLYSSLVMSPVLRICSFIPEIRQCLLSIKEIGEFKKISTSLKGYFDSLEIQGSYLFSMTPEYINLKKGDRILIDGASGSGKSLFIRGILECNEGIFKKIQWKKFQTNYPSEVLPRLGCIYLSETPVFESGTVTQNLGRSIEVIEDTIRKNKLFDDIKDVDLAKILSRTIDQSGAPLSQGERQRIQLLRALLQKSNFLVMDEALTGVPEKIEIDIVENLINSDNINCLIYVTHRESIKKLFHKKIIIYKK